MPKTILVVEDDPSMREGLKVTLELEGYDVATAADGQEAIQLLEASTPDLIIADVKMRHMDGLTLLGEVRQSERWRHIPTIIVTAAVEPAIESDARWRGAQAYLTKPFELEVLLSTVSQVLSKV